MQLLPITMIVFTSTQARKCCFVCYLPCIHVYLLCTETLIILLSSTSCVPMFAPLTPSSPQTNYTGVVGRMAEKLVVLPESFSSEGSWEDHFNNVVAVSR